jgi:tetratricopeptide (TPR) repeat protein
VTAAVLALAALLAAAPAPAQQELVLQGNQHYQEGDYAAAIEAYEAVLASGFESADLHYNLGNANFKAGRLGRAILGWERALAARPGAPDAAANLELARSLTADDVRPLPRFWLLSVASWWVDLVPGTALVALVGAGWLALSAGLAARILAHGRSARSLGTWTALGGTLVVLVLGTNLAVRELGIGRPERAVILAEVVPVRSAPAGDDNLTLFEIHEGTRVRVDRRTDAWAEIVLDDGKVGWVPADVMESI